MRRLLAILVAVASLSLSAAAQRGGFAGHFGGGHSGGASAAHFGAVPAGAGFHHGGFHHGFGAPGHGALISIPPFFGLGAGFDLDGGFFPFFPWFYEDGWGPSMPATAPNPQVIVIRDAVPSPHVSTAAAPPAQPKMIEVPGSSDVAQERPDAPATLVLRDGKEISVSRYTIMGQYLYDSSRPRHTTRIPLDQLDLEATERLNAQNGVPFSLPADSNEVMVRF